jgi:hypothetical protein
LKRHRLIVGDSLLLESSNPIMLAPLLWRDIVAIIDDGRQSGPAYQALTRLAAALKTEHPRGYGLLIIVPKNARPPSDQARRAINEALEAAVGGLKCVCWLVEGKGFQAAMVRAVLTGLRFFPRSAFESNVKSDLSDAVEWILRCIRGPSLDLETEVINACGYLCRQRPD